MVKNNLNKNQEAVLKALKRFHKQFRDMSDMSELQHTIEEESGITLSGASISRILDDLEEINLVRRNPDTNKIELVN